MSFQFLNLIDMAQTIGEDEVKSILSDFSCVKNAEIERFVRQNALEFSKKKMASTFLIMNEESDLVGVFALAHKALVFSADILTNTQKKRAARFASLDPETHTYTASAANLYAYGRYSWDPDLQPEDVLRDWARITYSLPEAQETALTQLLLGSRRTYELYTATLGTCWMVTPGFHYGPNPYGYEFQSWGTYNRADRNGVGVDRTEQGTGYLLQYPEHFRKLYSREHCPDDLLLFFHRVGYLEKLRDGRTLIQRIYDDHFEGYERTLKMREQLAALDLPEPDRAEALKRMALQVKNAKEWCDIVNTFFHRFSGVEDERGRTIYT